MTDRQRNLFLIGLFVAIVVAIFFFGRFLRPDDFTTEQPAIRRTATATVTANQTTEAQSTVTTGTSTPTPSS